MRIKWVIFAGLCAVINAPAAGLKPAQERPNVLLIVLDDMNDWLGVMGGHPQARTPHMDRLAAEGVLFLNAQANVAVCSPSRASFLSGVHPLNSGCWGFENPLRNETLTHTKTLPEYARENGYTTWQTGKIFHNVPPGVWDGRGIRKYHGPMAWNGKKAVQHPACPVTMDALGVLDSTFAPLAAVPSVPASEEAPGYTGWWDTADNKPFRYASEEDRDQMVDERSVEWLRRQLASFETQKNVPPFFIAFGIMRPHTPLVVPQPYFDLFPLEKIQLPALLEDDIDDLPWGEKSRGRQAFQALSAGYADSEEGLKKYVQAYLASAAFADEMAGRALSALENSRFKENTTVILFSDHGYNIGEKEYLWKYNLWEESCRVPLIIRDPRYAANAGKRVEHPVSLIDVFPTIADLCGMSGSTVKNSKGAAVDGHSLRPFLENPQTTRWNGPEAALSVIGSWKSKRPVDQHLSLRTRHYRYSLYYGGGEELYDHRKCSHEWRNLAADPAYTKVKKQLKKQLHAMLPVEPPETGGKRLFPPVS